MLNSLSTFPITIEAMGFLSFNVDAKPEPCVLRITSPNTKRATNGYLILVTWGSTEWDISFSQLLQKTHFSDQCTNLIPVFSQSAIYTYVPHNFGKSIH